MIILERLYFDPETESFYNEEEEEVVSIYSEKERKRRRNLDDPILRNNRGYGRAAAIGIWGNGGSLIGGIAGTHAGKEKAIKLARQGADDDEIMDRSASHGGRMGALIGLGTGAGIGAAMAGKNGAIAGGLANGLLGAAGGYFGTKKNVQERLDREKALRLRGGKSY